MLCMDELIRDIRQADLNQDTKIYMDFGGKEWETKIALKMHKEIEDELLKKNEFRWIQIGTKYRISKKSFDERLDKV